jgi:hypothetical protein
MQLPAWLSCVHPSVWDAILVLITVGVLHAALLWMHRLRGGPAVLLVYPAIILLALWLGSYRSSPLGFSTGRIPLLNGFLIRKPQMAPSFIRRNEVVSVAAGAPIGIQAILLPGPSTCIWASTTGGIFDDPNNCDTAYESAPAARYDVLRLHITSACGLPAVSGQIRISVLPP